MHTVGSAGYWPHTSPLIDQSHLSFSCFKCTV